MSQVDIKTFVEAESRGDLSKVYHEYSSGLLVSTYKTHSCALVGQKALKISYTYIGSLIQSEYRIIGYIIN